MFISRSKVKDLILRTITKFAYMIQGKKGTNSQVRVAFMKFGRKLHCQLLAINNVNCM